MVRAPRPLVSVGVPVFNGEKGLARCLDSLLAQDYRNIEIVISDNASTDATPEICARYAATDPRVRYSRAEQNRGSSWNFNRVFDLSSGEYFMWAAHDDERHSSFVSACAERLEERPDAVLCAAHTAAYIEGHELPAYVARLDSFEGVTGMVARYRETLKRFPATGVYGLFRSSALRKTNLLQRVIASDVALMLELSIHGSFVQVPRTLFNYRARRNWNTVHDDIRVFLGISRKPWWYVPFVVVFLNHVSRIAHAALPWTSKLSLCGALVVHHARMGLLKTLLKVAGALCPESKKESLGRAIYWRFMHNPNLEVITPDLFFQRVCKPQLGWWR